MVAAASTSSLRVRPQRGVAALVITRLFHRHLAYNETPVRGTPRGTILTGIPLVEGEIRTPREVGGAVEGAMGGEVIPGQTAVVESGNENRALLVLLLAGRVEYAGRRHVTSRREDLSYVRDRALSSLPSRYI